MSRYEEIYNRMVDNVEYAAKDLGVAGATLTAMMNRGLIERTSNSSPYRYRKVSGNPTFELTKKILSIVKDNNADLFTLFKRNKTLGMLCSYDKANSRFLDCWGKAYDISDVFMMQVKGQKYQLTID